MRHRRKNGMPIRIIANPMDDRTGLTSHKFTAIAQAAVPKAIGVHGYPQTRNGRGNAGLMARSRMSATAVIAKNIQVANIV